MFPMRAKSCAPGYFDGGLEAARGGRLLRDPAADAFHQRADQPDTRHPAALDAIRHALHALHRRRQRTRLPAHRKTRRKSPLSSVTPLIVPMKPTPKSRPELAPLLAFGAHPDDIEFGCGGVIARETRAGRAGTFRRLLARRSRPPTARPRNGLPRRKNPPRSWVPRLNSSNSTATPISRSASPTRSSWRGVLRRLRPGIVLAPSLVENQHPDHARLGQLVRDAARLARYGGVKELRALPPHAIEQLVLLRGDARSRTPGRDAGADRCLRAGNHRRLDRRDGSARIADRKPATTSNCNSRARVCADCAPASVTPLPCFPTIRSFLTRSRS